MGFRIVQGFLRLFVVWMSRLFWALSGGFMDYFGLFIPRNFYLFFYIFYLIFWIFYLVFYLVFQIFYPVFYILYLVFYLFYLVFYQLFVHCLHSYLRFLPSFLHFLIFYPIFKFNKFRHLGILGEAQLCGNV